MSKFRSQPNFLRNQSGIAAVEFALVLPLMVALWLGMVQMMQVSIASAKTTMAAQAVADLMAQQPTLSAADYTNLVGAAQTILSSADANNPSVSVVSLTYNNSGTASQAWACSSGNNAMAPVISGGNNLATAAGQGVIMVTVVYTYAPTITGMPIGGAQSSVFDGNHTFTATAYSMTRSGIANPASSKPC